MIYARLDAMEFNHLYWPGSVIDQDPLLLDAFDVIHRAKGIAQKEEQDKREREMKNKSASNPRKGGRRIAGR